MTDTLPEIVLLAEGFGSTLSFQKTTHSCQLPHPSHATKSNMRLEEQPPGFQAGKNVGSNVWLLDLRMRNSPSTETRDRHIRWSGRSRSTGHLDSTDG